MNDVLGIPAIYEKINENNSSWLNDGKYFE